ncbi:hypothetical protein [Paraglaciecola sp. L1A13]|uniref:hypothetical protein n=1 Tax=Paraglaciecola sp. L1A13 TaxID=2686359 RepID=UPI001E421C91|nr:hypothetical protein [Paraglaciecola sp. L1A13]
MTDNNGVLLSSGSITNTGTPDVKSGTIINQGQLINRGHIVVNDILFNSGVINNLEGAQFEKNGLINNTKGSLISFSDGETLDRSIINNGLITMADNELLTLTGDIMGADILLATYFYRAQVSALVIAPVDDLRRRRDRT